MIGAKIMLQRFGRVLPVSEQERRLAFWDRIERRGKRLSDRERDARATLLQVRAKREADAAPDVRAARAIGRMSLDQVRVEIAALDALSRRQRLTIEESDRLAALIARETRLEQLLAARVERARARLAKLEAEAARG